MGRKWQVLWPVGGLVGVTALVAIGVLVTRPPASQTVTANACEPVDCETTVAELHENDNQSDQSDQSQRSDESDRSGLGAAGGERPGPPTSATTATGSATTTTAGAAETATATERTRSDSTSQDTPQVTTGQTSTQTSGTAPAEVLANGPIATDPPPEGTPTADGRLRPTMFWDLPGSTMNVDQRWPLNVWNSAYRPTHVSVGPADVCTRDGDSALPLRAGRCTITAEVPGDADWAPVTESRTFEVVGKAAIWIRFSGPDSMDVGTTATLFANASSTTPVDISAPDPLISLTVSGPCRIQGTQVTATAVGSCQVTASRPETTDKRAATAEHWIVVRGLRDTGSLQCSSWCEVAVGQTVTARLSSNSGLPMSATTAGPCTIVGSTAAGANLDVTVRGDSPGSCSVRGTTQGDSTREPAYWVTSVNVVAAPTP